MLHRPSMEAGPTFPPDEGLVPYREENGILSGGINRLLQFLAQFGPGGQGMRARLHRWRGVTVGREVWIGYDVVIETAHPGLVSIGDYSMVNMRTTIIGHFKGEPGDTGVPSVRIGADVFIGAASVILPNLVIGDGAVVTAGSVVTRSVPAMMLVQGNPAEPVARCGIPLTRRTTLKEFTENLRPV